MEVGPTGGQRDENGTALKFASRFRGDEIVEAVVQANAEYLVIWARDSEFAYYDSKFLPKPVGLGDRDVLREAVDSARAHELPVIAYCQLQYPSFELREHEDWKMRDHQGNSIDHLVCFNSPYREYVKLLLREMLEYGIDGFHLDMVDQGFGPPHGCWCSSCRDLFRMEYGMDLPEGVDWDDPAWKRMLEFRYATSDRFENELVAFIRSQNPEVTVDFNYHGNPPFSWEIGQTPVRHANNGDFVTGEAGLWAFGALAASFNAQWYRGATPDKPFQVAIQRGVRMYHDQTTRPLNDIRWELMTLLAHGAFVTMIDKTGYDGRLDSSAYERIGLALGEARRKRSHFGQQPIQDIGIFFSVKTRDQDVDRGALDHVRSVIGIQKACVLEHLSHGFLFDETLNLEIARRFPVICLPNVAVLSDAEFQVFHDFVAGGGKLLVTGRTGLWDELGKNIPAEKMERLAGAHSVGEMEDADAWLRFGVPAVLGSGQRDLLQALSGDEIPSGWPFLVEGPAIIYKPSSGGGLGDLMDSDRKLLPTPESYNKSWPLSARSVAGPAVVANRIGDGEVLTLAASPGSAMAGEHGIVEVRKLFANAVRHLHQNPRVRVEAPANVEAVVTDDPEERVMRIHLLGYYPTPQTTPSANRPYVFPGLIEDKPIFRVSVHVSEPLKDAEVLGPDTVLKRSGSQLDLLVSDVHEILILHY